jgi:ketosteroid isomerase-like protein
MRIHRTVIAASFLPLLGCSSESVAPPPPVPVNWQSLEARPVADAGRDVVTAKERALAEAYVAALGSPDFVPLGPLLDEDAHFVAPGMEDAHGRGPVVRAHDILLGAFEGHQVALSRVWRTPNEQTLEWTATGTQTREWMGVPPTQKAIAFKGVSLLWTRDDGSIADVHVYFDVAVVKAALGVGPKELVALPAPAPSGGQPQVFEQSGASEETTNMAVVRAEFDALEGNNESGYLAALTDDVEVHTLERAQPARGKADARAYSKAMHKAIGQLDTTVTGEWGVGPFVIVEYDIDGEQLGSIGWIPPRRDQVAHLDLVDLCELTGGKIARVWRYGSPQGGL